MNPGLEKALMLVEKYRVCSTPNFPRLRDILLQEGLLVKFFSLSGSITGIYYRTLDGIELLTIKNGLSELKLKHMLAYGLAYHLLYLSSVPLAHVKVIHDFPKHGFDDEAENFASVLLVPPQAMLDYGRQISPGEISRLARIPESLAQRRIDIAKRFLI